MSKLKKTQSLKADNYDFWVKHLKSLGYEPDKRFFSWYFGYTLPKNIFSSILDKDNRENWYD